MTTRPSVPARLPGSVTHGGQTGSVPRENPPVLDRPVTQGQAEATLLSPLRAPHGLSPRLRLRRAVTLLLVTAVLPGAAQVLAGGRRLGRFALRVWLGAGALVLLLGALALLDRSLVLGLLTHPLVLSLLALACYAWAALWAWLYLDAWRLGDARRLSARGRRGLAGLTAVLVLVSGGVAVGAGQRAAAAGDFISAVFGGNARADQVHGRYNVLLLGGDAGPDRVGVRPDSMTLASVDAETGRTVLFSLPRNLENVHFPAGTPAAQALPQGWSCGDVCLLNALYTWGTEHKQLFPGAKDPGAAAMEQAVEGVLGLKVSSYVLIDLRGFISLIDALGGIDITVGAKVPIGGETSKISGYIQPGRQHLNGYHALWYARSRAESSDYDRMVRQKCVMSAMLNQLDPATVLARFQAIAAAGEQVMSTDIAAADLPMFVDLATRAKSQKITNVQLTPPLIDPAHPDFALIRATVTKAIDAAQAGSAKRPAARASTAGTTRATGPVPTPTPSPSAAASATSSASAGTDVSQICAAD